MTLVVLDASSIKLHGEAFKVPFDAQVVNKIKVEKKS